MLDSLNQKLRDAISKMSDAEIPGYINKIVAHDGDLATFLKAIFEGIPLLTFFFVAYLLDSCSCQWRVNRKRPKHPCECLGTFYLAQYVFSTQWQTCC
jgi:hypothetical protein